MKTESEKIEISKQVAEIVGRPASSRQWNEQRQVPRPVYLVQDHGACAEIAADRRMDVDNTYDDFTQVSWLQKNKLQLETVTVVLADFPSRIEATNWAILMAVIEQNKDSGK